MYPIRREVKKYEEYAYVLDFIPHGLPSRERRHVVTALAQVVGEMEFTLLEVTIKPGIRLTPGQRIYVGRGRREEIDHVIGRISYDDLTEDAKERLPQIIRKIVENNERRFIEFINTCRPISPKRHSLSLLSGIGKKYTTIILRERENRRFESFKDLEERTGIHDVVGIIVRRIVDELRGDEKYHLFTRRK